tara:strand:- start:174 stop:740 length:567 start_codon:yes stop_codon:yes gene_type:complete
MMSDFIENLNESLRNLDELKQLQNTIEDAAEMVINALRGGNKIIFCGNGGSAADSQHLAAELMGRYLKDRNPLPAISLTVDTSALTAIGNDYGYDHTFSRQLRGIGSKGDILYATSTSGNSRNILEAMKVAKDLGIKTIGVTGSEGRKITEYSDLLINVPSNKTNKIQEMHIIVGHYICGKVEKSIFP